MSEQDYNKEVLERLVTIEQIVKHQKELFENAYAKTKENRHEIDLLKKYTYNRERSCPYRPQIEELQENSIEKKAIEKHIKNMHANIKLAIAIGAFLISALSLVLAFVI
jgi:hypothetical protein